MVIQDGPAILGYERFREQEERSSYGIVQDIVGSVLEASTYELDEPMKQTFSRIFFGAMSAAGESVTTAEDPKQAVARIEAAILFILEGLKSLAEQGVVLTDPAPGARVLAPVPALAATSRKTTLPPSLSIGTSSIQT